MTKKIDSKETKKMAKQQKGLYAEEYIEEGEEGTPEYIRVRLPNKKAGEMFGVADQLLGGARINVMCADGKMRLARVPGKFRKRMWIRVGDLVIVKPWEFQDSKADIVWRYTPTQANYLARKGFLPEAFTQLFLGKGT